jgi:hypothetical protein
MPPTNQNDQYDFILNPQKPPKQPLKIFKGNGMVQRAVIVGAGLVFLIVSIVFIMSFLNRTSNAQAQKLIELAQTQQEILRVAETADDKINDSELNRTRLITLITTRSAIKDTAEALGKRGKKADEKLIAKGQNPNNDKILTDAEQNSRFTEAYEALFKQQLDSYLLQIKSVHDSGSASEKESLAALYEQVQILKEELSS